MYLSFEYRKHRRISRTFLLKIFVSNRGCGLSARTSGHHAVNLHKLTLFSDFTVWIDLCSKIIRTSKNYTTVRIDHWFYTVLRVWWFLKEPCVSVHMIKPSPLKELLTGLMLRFFSSWTSLGRESPFRHKVVLISVDEGRSIREKSSPNTNEKRLRNLHGFQYSISWWNAWLLSYERTKKNVHQVLLYVKILLRNGQEWKILD